MGARSFARVPAVLVAAATCLIAAACQPPAPPPGPPTGVCRPDPFTPEVRAAFDAFGAAAHHLTAAVYDDRTGCWYHLRPGERVTTASVVKIEIMAGVLLAAQEQNRPLSLFEGARVAPMIHSSHDPSASALWGHLGSGPGMSAVGDRFGLTETIEVSPVWGLTSTTAFDQARFVHRLLQGPGPLDPVRRGLAWLYLRNIHPHQQWGIRAGWQVGHKNGFFDSGCCGWRVNSVGYVADPAGGGYSIAVLSDNWPNLAAGIPMVEAVADLTARSLTAPA